MAIKLYWCRGKGRSDSSQRNFGDYLSPILVELLSGQSVSYAPVHKAELMAIGSILAREQKARKLFFGSKLNIWGAGTVAPDLSFSPMHHYHAVRGRKSLEQIAGLNKELALGDPGLLCEFWWEGRARPNKTHKIGIIPHYTDKNHPMIAEAAKNKDVLLIDVFWPVEEVVTSILKCDFILSSSLHGLIVADSFGIPNRRVRLLEGIVTDYKFVDYYSAFNLSEPELLMPESLADIDSIDFDRLIEEYERPGLNELQDNLLKSFPFPRSGGF